MEFKIIRHRYEDTGGGCHVGFDDVWLPEENRTIYVTTNEAGCGFYTVDAYFGGLHDVDPFDWIELDTGKWLEHRYFQLAKECVRRFAIDKGEISMPYEWLPHLAQAQVTPHYRSWCDTENYGLFSTNGEYLIMEEDYKPPINKNDANIYYRLVGAMVALQTAFEGVVDLWDNPDVASVLAETDYYPFQDSIRVITSDITAWVDDVLQTADNLRKDV